MNRFEFQRQESLKRRWQERRSVPNINSPRLVNGAIPPSTAPFKENPNRLQTFPGLDDDDLVSTVVPPVTVVLEGRSICQRISLHKHASYQSLARALRQMFVDGGEAGVASEQDLDLSNAIPGHIIAYEDIENDLLLAGDLNWK